MTSNIQHTADCLRSTANALERCVDGVPEGFRLERCEIDIGSIWTASSAITSNNMNIREYHYRLVKET